ncbi:uncharacterized protein N7515_007118 [Penicillium bovifimosum]|uniref:Uncharacterized protein n=1 Tax=Penicillium bovifimosum TaxID=126998 RepID=A0A9W9GXJ2_9EURO|nr:uncharacterized protein N7515_007118 [Penicillium bovifimosum]KAJ5131079.1 hypothetical protein N7515_007118 [Penicillium bovifimosum]
MLVIGPEKLSVLFSNASNSWLMLLSSARNGLIVSLSPPSYVPAHLRFQSGSRHLDVLFEYLLHLIPNPDEACLKRLASENPNAHTIILPDSVANPDAKTTAFEDDTALQQAASQYHAEDYGQLVIDYAPVYTSGRHTHSSTPCGD